jgi:hypothetical protein
MLYGTTRKFLELFGLKDIDDLPRVEELRKAAYPKAAPPAQADQTDQEPNQTQDIALTPEQAQAPPQDIPDSPPEEPSELAEPAPEADQDQPSSDDEPATSDNTAL